MEKRRKYSQAFKQEAVQLTKQVVGAITQVAKDLSFNAACWGAGAGRRTYEGIKPLPGPECPTIKNSPA